MIKINLALRKQAAAVDGKEKRAEINVDSAKELLGEPNVRKALLAVVVIVMAWYLLDGYEEDQLKKVEAQIQRATAENQKMRQTLGKTSGYDAQKKQLDADEELIKSKLTTIQKLIADRADPSKLLMSFSSSIPKDVWLQEFDMTPKEIKITGSSLGFDPVTDFIKALGDNDLMTDVKLEDSKKIKDPIAGEVASFSVEAKRK